MTSISFYRKIIFILVNNRITYLAGMAVLRYRRKLGTRINSENSKGQELVEIHDFAGNIKMVVDKYSYMGGGIYWTGYHQLSECLYLKSFLKPEMTFVDAGANQGEFTLFAAKRLTKGRVLSFEPVLTNLVSLERNVKLNNFSNVTIIDKGLHVEPMELPIYTSVNAEMNEGLSTIYPDEFRNQLEQTIELINFDKHYLDELSRLDMIKIDIEGAELYALQGMEQTIDKFHPHILIELNRETALNAGYDIQEILDFLVNKGYRSHSIFRGRLKEQTFTSSMNFGNFVFIHN